MSMIHPLVRDLYKRVLFVGRDYPLGLPYVRETWKTALRNPENCPACYPSSATTATADARRTGECEKEIRKAVGKGRYMVKEMIGVIQLKKYRTLMKRYGQGSTDIDGSFVSTKGSK